MKFFYFNFNLHLDIMLVFNENYLNIFPIFKEIVNKEDFVSLDCEMTGVTLESKTDGTKYDTQ